MSVSLTLMKTEMTEATLSSRTPARGRRQHAPVRFCSCGLLTLSAPCSDSGNAHAAPRAAANAGMPGRCVYRPQAAADAHQQAHIASVSRFRLAQTVVTTLQQSHDTCYVLDVGSRCAQKSEPAARRRTMNSPVPTACSADGQLLACALSDRSVKVYAAGPAGLAHVATCGGHSGTVVHVSLPFADAPHVVLTASSSDATLRCFDARAPGGGSKPVAQFRDAHRRELASAAASSQGHALVAGAEDGTVLLWDRRAAQPAGGAVRAAAGEYSEAHGEPVTCCAFHPALPHALLTAGVDGLVCVFDTSVASAEEDDALQRVLSVGSSVAKVGWYGPQGSSIWALTSTEDLSLWNWADGERLAGPPQPDGTRAALMEAWRRVSGGPVPGEVSYCCGCAWDARNGTLVVLAGTQDGTLGAWPVTPSTGGTVDVHPPAALFAGGHTDVVRAATWLGAGASTLVTGGEDGRLCVWLAAGPQEEGPPVGAAPRSAGGAERSKSSSQGRYSPY